LRRVKIGNVALTITRKYDKEKHSRKSTGHNGPVVRATVVCRPYIDCPTFVASIVFSCPGIHGNLLIIRELETNVRRTRAGNPRIVIHDVHLAHRINIIHRMRCKCALAMAVSKCI
jgi:hypothetical protein